MSYKKLTYSYFNQSACDFREVCDGSIFTNLPIEFEEESLDYNEIGLPISYSNLSSMIEESKPATREYYQAFYLAGANKHINPNNLYSFLIGIDSDKRSMFILKNYQNLGYHDVLNIYNNPTKVTSSIAKWLQLKSLSLNTKISDDETSRTYHYPHLCSVIKNIGDLATLKPQQDPSAIKQHYITNLIYDNSNYSRCMPVLENIDILRLIGTTGFENGWHLIMSPTVSKFSNYSEKYNQNITLSDAAYIPKEEYIDNWSKGVRTVADLGIVWPSHDLISLDHNFGQLAEFGQVKQHIAEFCQSYGEVGYRVGTFLIDNVDSRLLTKHFASFNGLLEPLKQKYGTQYIGSKLANNLVKNGTCPVKMLDIFSELSYPSRSIEERDIVEEVYMGLANVLPNTLNKFVDNLKLSKIFYP